MVAGGDDHVNFETDQLIGQSGEPVELIIGVSILEGDVLALNIAERAKLPPENLNGARLIVGTDSEKTDLGDLGLLCVRR